MTVENKQHKTITFDNHLFVFGGCDKINPKKAKTFYHTIDKLDLTTKKWSSLTNTEVKSNEGERKTNSKVLLEFPRVIFHSAILIDCVVYIFGGIDEYFQPQRDVLTFDLQNNKISSLPGSMLLSSFIAQNVFDVQYENQPSALFFSSSFVKSDKKRIIEEAENNNSEDKLIKDEEKPTFDTLNLYFPKKQQFQHISIENGISPPLLHFYSSVHSNNQIYIFGGSNTHFIWYSSYLIIIYNYLLYIYNAKIIIINNYLILILFYFYYHFLSNKNYYYYYSYYYENYLINSNKEWKKEINERIVHF